MKDLRIIVWDIEIAKEVTEVGGWDAAREGAAGVSSVALYDSATKRFHIYGPSLGYDLGEGFFASGPGTLPECTNHLNEADILVGFNTIGFDVPAYEGYMGDDIVPLAHFDILDNVWNALGANKHKGYRLNDICKRTLNKEKTGDGESAPRLFRAGHIAKLHDYNINDVALTLDLFNFIEKHGFIIDVNGEQLELPTLGVKCEG